METRANYVLVGSFILILLGGLVAFILWVTKSDEETKEAPYVIYFEQSVSGLDPGSTVYYRGVPVGSVSDIRIDPENFQRIRVLVSLRADTPIKTDAVATLRLEGITGQRSIEIKGGSAEAPLLAALPGEEYPVIVSRPSDIEAILGGAPQLLEQITMVAMDLSTLLNPENRAAIGTTLKNVAAVSDTLAAQREEIGATLGDLAAMAQDMRTAAGELSAAMAEAHGAFATVNEETAALGPELQNLVGELGNTSRSLTAASEELRALVAENRAPIQSFATEGLYELSLLIGELRALTESLSRIAEEFESNPPGFLFGTPSREVEVP